MENVRFTDVVDIKKWQVIQDHCAAVLGLQLRTIDADGALLVRPSGASRFCELVNTCCLPAPKPCQDYVLNAQDTIETLWQNGDGCCVQGISRFFVPVKAGEETVAYVLVGPVIVGKRQDAQVYRQSADKLNVESEALLDVIREMKVFSFSRMKSLVELVYEIGRSLCTSGYENALLKGVFSEDAMAAEVLKRIAHDHVEHLLESLLESSSYFLGAERASIMVLDETGKQLYIKRAKGISPEIIRQARSRLGEGIAGIVAEEKKPLFIDDSIADDRIRRQLRNPAIKYAVAVPLRVKEKIWGVLNLATGREQAEKFTADKLTALEALTHMAENMLTTAVSPA